SRGGTAGGPRRRPGSRRRGVPLRAGVVAGGGVRRHRRVPDRRARSPSAGEARMIAREELYDAGLARGRAREIVPELTELVAAFPLREKLTGQLMLALHRSGRQTRALTAYRTLGRRLSRDLGTGPGPELRDLYERIRAEDPDLRHHDDA